MKDFEAMDDDQLHENYEAYKALIEAGIAQKDALIKTGLTAQIVKDFEAEEEEDEFKDEFKEVWGSDDEDFDENDWNEEPLEEEDSWEDSDSLSDSSYDDYDDSSFDER